MSILYSPIGKSDPIRSDHDGPWLHICRVHRPRMTMIYLSAEMCQKDDKGTIDKTLELLNQSSAQQIEVRRHRDPKMIAAHEFEPFIDIFRRDLDALHDEFPREELLINVSSGTAGMKTALVFLANLLPYPVRTIQVSNPWFDRKSDQQVDEEFDPELAWEMNEDNKPDFVNRTIDSNWQRYAAQAKIDDICQWIDSSEYYAAYRAAQQSSCFLSENVMKALEGAWRRYLLQTKIAGKLLNQSGFSNHLEQNADSNEWQIAEYLLMMRTKARHGEVADVLRCMTPVLCRICEYALERAGHPIKEIGMRIDENGSEYWDKSVMTDQDIFTLRIDRSERPFVETKNLLNIMSNYCPSDITAAAKELRNVELAVRNEVAHRIVSCDDKDIQRKVRLHRCQTRPNTATDIVDELYNLFRQIAISNELKNKVFWTNSSDHYTLMNEHIKKLLHQSAAMNV